MLCEELTNINTDNIIKLLLILLIFQGDKMEFLCNTNYILFPTSDNAQNKRLYFYIDNELVYDIVLKLDNAAFASFVIPNNPFGSCLNIPQNMTIKTINGEPYLSALPVKEFETLYKNRDVKTDVVINSDMPFIKSIQSKACDISVSASAEQSFSLELFGLKISFNADDKILQCLDKSAPLKCENGTVDLRIIFDTLYTEIFADFGTVFMGMTYIADSNLNSLSIKSKNATIHNIRVSELNSIH